MVEFRGGEAMTRSIAVIAAHPDDEVLGCGAAIARHTAAGEAVHVLIMAEGVTSRSAAPNSDNAKEQLAELALCAHRAHEILGSESLELLAFPDNRMDSVDMLAVVKSVEVFLAKVHPDTVYTHFPADLNVDHRIVSEAVQIACRPVPTASVRRVLMFEVASSTDWRLVTPVSFNPNYFIDVTMTIDKKMRALAAYGSEMRPAPHARSLTGVAALATWRGATVGVGAAEAFVLGRAIV
jgi:N-acetylglucosamine malate deacetylase 1